MEILLQDMLRRWGLLSQDSCSTGTARVSPVLAPSALDWLLSGEEPEQGWLKGCWDRGKEIP